MIELNLEEEICKFGATIKVMGIGGAGGNAVNSMITSNHFSDIEFIVANTDLQALKQSPAPCKIQLGAKITKGLGAGANPDLGRKAAEEDLESVIQNLNNTDILFLTAGLGGGTGTGALPVIVRAAKDLGILTIAVVTKPFLFEGRRRLKFATEAIETLRGSVDTLIVVPNQKLLEVSDTNISMLDAFAKSDDILNQAIKGISDIIAKPGHINVDFADVRTIMKDTGMAIMGIGRASGPNRAKDAALAAINSQLLENTNIRGAKGVLVNITGDSALGLQEICAATSFVSEMVSEDANIIFGTVIDESMGDEVAVTVIATGFENAQPATVASSPAITISQEIKTAPVAETAVAEKSVKIATMIHEDDLLECAADVKEGKIDLDDFDAPTFLRKKMESEARSHQN
ncbi:MAG: Cell division protein FtsZ [candidate division TM6 bacterium GW2011_GWF2_37_49]|nr:MAG: Cell division protein FtsZ [candidate division TM6 bacterium GW2011_GWF2_37_49]